MKAAEEAEEGRREGRPRDRPRDDRDRVEKDQLETDKRKLEADKAALKAERDALEARLGGALSQIMTVRESARGIVMDLGDVLFDVGKATLKPGARESLAKLSGVLLMLPDVNLRIEGFTDSTGSAETNKVLSANRAKSVYDYLITQKIDAARMAHAGYGPANPVGRQRHGRRARARTGASRSPSPGASIEPTPGGFTAPEPAAPAKPAAEARSSRQAEADPRIPPHGIPNGAAKAAPFFFSPRR